MKPTLGTVAITASPNNLWTRIDIPPLAFIEHLWLSSSRADLSLEVKMRVNGQIVFQPINRSDVFILPPDSALTIPDVYYIKRSNASIIFEFQASAVGAEVTFAYFEMLNPVPMVT